MRTRTIFEALSRVYRGTDWVIPAKRYRQHHTFERELLRRMDERDALVAQRNWDAIESPVLVDAQGHKYKAPRPRTFGGGK